MFVHLSRKNLIIRSVLTVFVLALFVLVFFFGDEIGLAEAATSSVTHSEILVEGYSDPLSDLNSDPSFDSSLYPSDDEDYSLELIQIAESDSNELYLYVYQPYTKLKYDLTATKVSISLTKSTAADLSYKLYNLTLLSYNGVFYKYRVDGLFASNDESHYYSISAIYRTFYNDIDGDYVGDNTTSGLAIAVSQQWEVYVDELGNRGYFMSEIRTVEINPYYSWVRYGGFQFEYIYDLIPVNRYFYTDCHFGAFSVDFDIDQLLEADLSFTLKKYSADFYHSSSNKYDWDFESSTEEFVTVTAGETHSVKVKGVSGWFNKDVYTFDEIQTPDEFFDSLDDTDEIEYKDDDLVDLVNQCDWVLNFWQSETILDHKPSFSGSSYFGSYYDVVDISILRLKYEFQGEIYNVGVVSNISSENPDKENGSFATNENHRNCSAILILCLILGLILILLLFPLLPYIFKGIIWIICAPFKFIKWCCKKSKERKEKKSGGGGGSESGDVTVHISMNDIGQQSGVTSGKYDEVPTVKSSDKKKK